jgi:hypothetical protein
MDDKPLIMIVRLWRRGDDIITAVRPLESGERRSFTSTAELLEYLETLKRSLESAKETEGGR